MDQRRRATYITQAHDGPAQMRYILYIIKLNIILYYNLQQPRLECHKSHYARPSKETMYTWVNSQMLDVACLARNVGSWLGNVGSWRGIVGPWRGIVGLWRGIGPWRGIVGLCVDVVAVGAAPVFFGGWPMGELFASPFRAMMQEAHDDIRVLLTLQILHFLDLLLPLHSRCLPLNFDPLHPFVGTALRDDHLATRGAMRCKTVEASVSQGPEPI